MGISFRPNGMTSAAHALRYWERRQEVVSNNLANVSTDGFKAERAFASLMDGALPEIDTATDLRAGTLRPTGAPLDLAMGGDGFLVVQSPDGERLSRGGALRLDDQHRLVTAQGYPVLGERGPVVLDAADAEQVDAALTAAGTDGGPLGALVQVSREGTVRVGDRTVGTLRVERVAPGTRLQHAGDALFLPPAATERTPVPPAERDVRQGVLEESNVDSVSALVEMITVQRAYASVQKAMTTLDSARGMVTNEIGKPV
ncbi:MAG TPA: flagellar hook-basal body protein [Gemmatimonadaceae bacterium]|nr:flagellar hook-basal body protein [Gemmatimonadaceae bacterium]